MTLVELFKRAQNGKITIETGEGLGTIGQPNKFRVMDCDGNRYYFRLDQTVQGLEYVEYLYCGKPQEHKQLATNPGQANWWTPHSHKVMTVEFDSHSRDHIKGSMLLTFEAFVRTNSNLNWNVLPTGTRSAPPIAALTIPSTEVTYHKDIKLPKDFEKPKPGTPLRYGMHGKQALQDDGVEPPMFVPPAFEIIEVTMMKYRVIKWVIRYHYNDRDDLVMVIQPDGFVRTAWVNSRTDSHRTLDRSKYAAYAAF